jgi:predicted ATPase
MPAFLFGISVAVTLPGNLYGGYAFQLGALPDGGFQVLREECRVGPSFCSVREGKLVQATTPMRESIEPDRLYLTYASTFPEFRGLFDALSRMVFLNLNPEALRALQDPDPGELLARDGRNAASVIRRLRSSAPKAYERIVEYVRAIVPGVQSVESRPLGPKETLEFRQQVAANDNPWKFLASSMSDGTLRVLGVLVGLFQGQENGKHIVPLIGIEEPEIALHPAAASKLMDALLEASRRVQILVTTHSPDLLDHTGIRSENVLAVDNRGGETIISVVDEASRSAVRDRLYTVGDLLRMGQVAPDERAFDRSTGQLKLFPSDDGP